MEEQTLTPEMETEQNTNEMYIEEIKRLKSTTVSREQYDKILAENKNLLQSLVDGVVPAAAETPEQKPDIAELRKELFSSDKEFNNLEYCQRALALRQAVLDQTGEDIFVGKGHDLTPTPEAYASAQRVADVMADAIEYANGNSEVFTTELMRRTNDIKIPRGQIKK